MVRNKGKRLDAYVKDYIVFDLETTGISQVEDEIVEISAVKVREHQVVDTFSTLVNPGMPIPRSATAVNGITNKMVKDAPMLKEALSDFLDFIGDDILVGHNIHTFDTNFIYDGAVREFGREVHNDYIDTLYMARRTLPQLDHHRLVDLAEYYRLDTEGAHRALFDCEMNQICYEKIGVIWQEMQKKMKAKKAKVADKAGAGTDTEDDAPSCPECGSPMVRRKGKFGEFFGCSGYPFCKCTQKIKGCL